MIYRIIFIAILMALGITLNLYNIGSNEFFGQSTVGNYLIYIGFVMILVTSLNYFRKREKIIDERIEMLRYKAGTLTFMAFIFVAFAIIVLDGIQPITMRYSLFISYLVCAILVFYVIAYKVLERKY
jgi:L-asparagine transporter-like permease